MYFSCSSPGCGECEPTAGNLPHCRHGGSRSTTLIRKENEIFLISKEIQMGSVAKSYMRKGFLIYEEMLKYLTIHEEAVSHI
jgi:hypothetical protein